VELLVVLVISTIAVLPGASPHSGHRHAVRYETSASSCRRGWETLGVAVGIAVADGPTESPYLRGADKVKKREVAGLWV
jgi:hypothetical protein